MKAWEYRDHPKCKTVLPRQTESLLNSIFDGALDIRSSLIDTRAIHLHLFEELTPKGCKYFAGHYRGEDFPKLKNYRVTVQGNPSVGAPPSKVEAIMRKFGQELDHVLTKQDSFWQENHVEPGKKIRKTVNLACSMFVEFSRIHPYANGNGHVARFLLIAILSKYGYKVKNWPLEPRPIDPPYTQLIRLYENGDKAHLMGWILQKLEKA